MAHTQRLFLTCKARRYTTFLTTASLLKRSDCRPCRDRNWSGSLEAFTRTRTTQPTIHRLLRTTLQPVHSREWSSISRILQRTRSMRVLPMQPITSRIASTYKSVVVRVTTHKDIHKTSRVRCSEG